MTGFRFVRRREVLLALVDTVARDLEHAHAGRWWSCGTLKP